MTPIRRTSRETYVVPDGTRIRLGQQGEKAAAAFLKNLGYRIAAKNYACSVGEIDLVAIDGDTVVFVEVRARSSVEDSYPEETIRYHKQRRTTRAAKTYVAHKSLHDRPCRFDVVAVVLPNDGPPEIEHFVDAYGPTPR